MEVNIQNKKYFLRWEYKNFELERLLTEAGISLESAKAMKGHEVLNALGLSTMPKPNRLDLIVTCEEEAEMKVFSVNLNGSSKKALRRIQESAATLFPGKWQKKQRHFYVSNWKRANKPLDNEEARKRTISLFANKFFPKVEDTLAGAEFVNEENRSYRRAIWEAYLGRKSKKPGYKQLVKMYQLVTEQLEILTKVTGDAEEKEHTVTFQLNS